MNIFPKIRQPEGSLYCGPYCVVACLYALERLPLTSSLELQKFDSKTTAFTGNSIQVNGSQGLIDLALELYKITGIITPGENPDYIEHSGYNSLGAMLYVLRQFGLKCSVVIRDDGIYKYLRQVFPTEFELIDRLDVPVNTLSEGKSTPDGTMLISVISVNGSLHYILNNALGNWFDSDISDSSAAWDFIENWESTVNKRSGASWLGVSIRIEC